MNVRLARRSLVIVPLCLLFAGVGFYIGNQKSARVLENLNQGHPLREQKSNYTYINPLLAYETGSGSVFREYAPLEETLNEHIQEYKKSGQAKAVSVYYKDLTSGRWVGINEDDSYIPASLLKAVIMIAYFRQAEEKPETLSETFTFIKTDEQAAQINPYDAPSKLEDKKSYTVKDLIRAMITDSDNGAKDLLLEHIDRNSLNEVYSDLGLKNPDDSNGGPYTISAKSYSLFFRVLYNSTYINRQFSEEALKLLASSTFRDGLVRGVPKDVIVAHKFGESVTQQNSGELTIELHDCGIVYKPNKPFLLCVMTKGSNLEGLQNTIQNLTETVYSYTQ